MRVGSSLVDIRELDTLNGPSGDKAGWSLTHNLDHLCLKIADFNADAIREELSALSVSVSEIDTRYGASGDGQSVYLQDPDGNELELRG